MTHLTTHTSGSLGTLMRAFKWVAFACAIALSSACTTAHIGDYADDQPSLDLRNYFNGPVTAYGMFQDRSGRVRRVWRLTQHSDGRVTGEADDVVGAATGAVSGNAMQWRYTLRLPVDGSVYEVSMDDWMYLLNERIMINRTAMSKWGVHLGDVTLTFIKPAP
jgi:hypothetical protein